MMKMVVRKEVKETFSGTPKEIKRRLLELWRISGLVCKYKFESYHLNSSQCMENRDCLTQGMLRFK